MDVLSSTGSNSSSQIPGEINSSNPAEQLNQQEKAVGAVALPYLKGKTEVLNESLNKGLQERVRHLLGQLQGEILGFDAKKRMASAYSTEVPKPAGLQTFAADVFKKTQEHLTALAHSIQFWIEEEQATRNLWNGNYNARWTGGIDVGIDYQKRELSNAIEKQRLALQATPPDISFSRGKMDFLPAAQETTAAAQTLIQFAQTSVQTLSSALQLFKEQLQKTGEWPAFEDTWKQLSEEQATRATAAQELQKQYEEGLKAKYEELAGLTHLKTEIWKTNREGEFEESTDYKDYQEFKKYFEVMDETLKELVSIEGELKILNSIYGDITYYKKPLINYEMLCQEVGCDLGRLRGKFEELAQKFQTIPVYQIKAEYIRNFCQAHLKAIAQKQESFRVHEKHIRDLLPNLQKYFLPKKTVEDTTTQTTAKDATAQDAVIQTTAQDFIDARSNVRHSLTNLYLEQLKLTEEVQTGVFDKEAFAHLYFRFESLQKKVKHIESLQNQHIQQLEQAIKQATSLKEILEGLQKTAIQSNDKLEALVQGQGKTGFSFSDLLSLGKKVTPVTTGLSTSGTSVSTLKDKSKESKQEKEMEEVVSANDTGGTGGTSLPADPQLEDD